MNRILCALIALALSIPFVLVGCPGGAGNTANGNNDGGNSGNGGGAELDTETEFVISAISDQQVAKVQRRGGNLAKYLKATTGLNVRFQAAASYEATVAMFVNGEVQMAWFGGLTGCQARARTESTAIAQRDVDANFKSAFITHVDSDITMDPDDADSFRAAMAGKTLSFGAASSTSGRLMPQHFLQTLFGFEGPWSPDSSADPKIMFSGSHPATAAAVESGAAHVGALNYGTWKNVQDGNVENVDPSNLKEIWVTPGYYDYNWNVRNDVDDIYGAGCIETVRAAMVALDGENDDPELAELEKSICADYDATKFIGTKNENYKAIADVAIANGLLESD